MRTVRVGRGPTNQSIHSFTMRTEQTATATIQSNVPDTQPGHFLYPHVPAYCPPKGAVDARRHNACHGLRQQCNMEIRQSGISIKLALVCRQRCGWHHHTALSCLFVFRIATIVQQWGTCRLGTTCITSIHIFCCGMDYTHPRVYRHQRLLRRHSSDQRHFMFIALFCLFGLGQTNGLGKRVPVME